LRRSAAREAVLDLLLERAATVGELVAAIGRPRSTMAHHVKVLVASPPASIQLTIRRCLTPKASRPMDEVSPSMTSLMRKPSAWLPMVLSLATLTLIVVYVGLVGVVRHEDEGVPARLFQLLMVVEAVAIAFFAIRWVPEAPRPAIAILALQLLLAAIPVGTIIFLEA
jgi:hypothetical protein